MLTLGPLTFAVPAALLALALLPLLWWLLRVTPPAPRRLTFPPVRLLMDLVNRVQEAVLTPPWLLALRLLLAALLILAAARPTLERGESLPGSGPIALLVDNGWAAAPRWHDRQQALAALIDGAERAGRTVVLVPTAAVGADTDADSLPAMPVPAAKAREMVTSLRPQPWATDRSAAIDRLAAGGYAVSAIAWLSDGLGEGEGDAADRALSGRLLSLAPLRVLLPARGELAPLLRCEPGDGGRLAVTAVRAGSEGSLSLPLRLLADDASALAQKSVVIAAGSQKASLTLDLPAEWVQRLARVEIEGSEGAGAVALIDRRWQRRAVGIASEPGAVGEQPLLGRTFYVERALEPFAELRMGTIADLLQRQLAVLVLADVGRLDSETAGRVVAWVERGGVLLRFAGPRMAQAAGGPPDPLLPVPLRPGDRTLGGALSWGEGGRLAPFDAASPFHGLAVSAEITVSRQVLAEPTLDEATRTWARLADGSPLISGARLGDGWLVLVHTTANADWSNLALSGLFVELLRRITDLGLPGAGQFERTPLAPLTTLDGFGRLGAPPASARPLPARQLSQTPVGPLHPPGFYGEGAVRFALNLAPSVADPRPLTVPAGVPTAPYGAADGVDPLPWLLAAVLALALTDFAVSLQLRGAFGAGRGRRWRAGAATLLIAGVVAVPAAAQTVIADGTAPAAALGTSLAYIVTGDAETDRLSRAALNGLSTVVNRRTAAQLAPPVAVQPERDELAFYPLLYWPLVEPIRMPTPAAARRLAAYMRAGGTIVFDIRGGRGLAERADLREFARALDLPPLVPLAEDHVLKRSYYLLPDAPGRFVGATTWVEASGEHVNDGVSAVIAGANDWGGAWAVDDHMLPSKAVVPGGERQREMAYRFGVNLVMYVLTGNYKTDQVHLPAILERLRSAPR